MRKACLLSLNPCGVLKSFIEGHESNLHRGTTLKVKHFMAHTEKNKEQSTKVIRRMHSKISDDVLEMNFS